MNKGLLIYFFLIFITSCGLKPNTFQPETKEGQKSYVANEFKLLTQEQLSNSHCWQDMNTSDIEVGVFKVKNGVEFKEPKFDYPYYFELEDGKLEIKNHGEFGGEFNFIPSDKTKDTIRILNTNVISVFRFNGEIYFLVGIAHMMDSGGALLKLTRNATFSKNGYEFRYEKILNLESAPEAMTIYEDKIIIAGHKNLTVIHNLKKEVEIETYWGGLYPNSIAALNGDEIYVGIRAGYAKVSLTTKEVKYFEHNSVKPYVEPIY